MVPQDTLDYSVGNEREVVMPSEIRKQCPEPNRCRDECVIEFNDIARRWGRRRRIGLLW